MDWKKILRKTYLSFLSAIVTEADKILTRETGQSSQHPTYAEQALWEAGQHIQAIKSYRSRIEMGLRETKELFESLYGPGQTRQP